jgi:hypothetical protein
MRALINVKQKWKYYINLTGQEFTLKTNLEIVNMLADRNGSNIIYSNPILLNKRYKTQYKTVIKNDEYVITKERKEPFKHKIYKGSAYGIFSRELISFILNDTLVKEFLNWLNDTLGPEELFFSTLIMFPNAPGRNNSGSLKGNLYKTRAISWQPNDACYGKVVRKICIYGVKDLPGVVNSKMVIANKFYEDFEPLALDCIEIEMYNKLLKRQMEERTQI